VEGVHAGQNTARESEKIIKYMADAVVENGEASQRICDASKAQLSSFEELQLVQDRLISTFKESSGKVETTATIGDDLYAVTENLKSMLSDFHFERVTEIETADHEQRKAPRIENHLRVVVTRGEQQFEAISHDLSLTGMQLRGRHTIAKGDKVKLAIYLPHNDLDHYERQRPLDISATAQWNRSAGEYEVCGLSFEQPDAQQTSHLESCFAFYNKSPHYARKAMGI
jgi:methyl-accepting chemotaxis protein